MPVIPPTADDHYGVFTAAQAAAHGWRPGALRRAVVAGWLFRLQRGAYVETARKADPIDPSARELRLCQSALAAALTQPSAVISHHAAALLHRLPLLITPDRPCLTVVPGYTGDSVHAHLHRAGLRQVTSFGGVHVTASARTVADVARESGRMAGVVVADAALRCGLVTAVDLDRAARECRGWPGARRLRAAVGLIDASAESPLESVSRVYLGDMGIAAPRAQALLTGSDPAWAYRVDFYWDTAGVVGEADGELKYAVADALRAEKCRQEHLERSGLLVVRWGWRDVATLSGRLRLEQRLTDALARGTGSARPRGWTVH